jgi:DNA-binding beta-propeller fold protein YncE
MGVFLLMSLRPHWFLLVALAALGAGLSRPSYGRPVYRSPIDVAFSPDGALLAVADPTWGGVAIIDAQTRSVKREVPLTGTPSHVIWNGSDRLLVSEGAAGTVAEVDAATGTLVRRIPAVRRAAGLALTTNGQFLVVCDRGLNQVAFVDMALGEVVLTVGVVREPDYVALTTDNLYAVVGNKLPRSEDARLAEHGAEVSVIELSTGIVRNVRLPGGSSVVRQIAISPDNRWAYVIHQTGRANTMVTQLDKGWVMTNSASVIDIAEASLYTTLLFDKVGAGAANPWGVVVSPDGSKLWATLAGMSELATVNLAGLHALLADDPAARLGLHGDLQTMYAKDLLTRRQLSDVEGTRGLAINPKGTMLAAASYFEGKVLLVDLASDRIEAVALGANPAEDQIRQGERYYHSARQCYQQWLTCATCHEGGRMDGLNWDLKNDGQGNPKNTRSHVLSALTPPTNITGCRENAQVSVRAGFENIESHPVTEDIALATYAYVESLAAEPSPYLGVDGKLTPDAIEGKKIFDSTEAGCASCHKPPLFTDMRRHDVGTRLPAPLGPDISKWDEGGYDTPTLVELWRTAPYLHLGHAATLTEVLTSFNEGDKHGKTSHLSPQQINQLVAYLMQIGPSSDEAGTQPDGGTNPIVGPSPVPQEDDSSSCMCRMGAKPGASAASRSFVVGSIMLLLIVWRRRRESQVHANQGQPSKGKRL